MFRSPTERLGVSIVTVRAAVMSKVRFTVSPVPTAPGTVAGLQLAAVDQFPAASTFHDAIAACSLGVAAVVAKAAAAIVAILRLRISRGVGRLEFIGGGVEELDDDDATFPGAKTNPV